MDITIKDNNNIKIFQIKTNIIIYIKLFILYFLYY